jgi:hypothetical protein
LNLFNKKEPHNHSITFYSSSFAFSSFFPCQKSTWFDGAYISKGGTNNQEKKNGEKKTTQKIIKRITKNSIILAHNYQILVILAHNC